MRIAYIIALPVMIFLAVILILMFFWGKDLYFWAIPPVIILAILYVSQNELQWWFAQFDPPKLLDREIELLSNNSQFYNELDEEEKERYQDRLALLHLTRRVKTISDEDVPDDIVLLICIPIIEMSFYDEYFFTDEYQQIVIYPHPFMSPQYGDQIHISEVEHEDGVLVFSIEQLIPGLEKKMFNIAAYEWARAYLFKNDRATFVKCIDKQEVKENLIKVAQIKYDQLKKVIGLEDLDDQAIGLSLFFDRPYLMKMHMPVSYEGIGKVFNDKRKEYLKSSIH